MTLVVYNKGIIAADRINSSGGHILGYVDKFILSADKKRAAAGAGLGATIQAFFRWFSEGAEGTFIQFSRDEYEGKERSATCCIFEHNTGKHYVNVYSTLGHTKYEIPDGMFALGIAEEYAIGAMQAGAGITDVFLIANKYCPIVSDKYDIASIDLR